MLSRVADNMASARGRYAMAQARGVVAIRGSFKAAVGGKALHFPAVLRLAGKYHVVGRFRADSHNISVPG
jgi:hypothetical protein